MAKLCECGCGELAPIAKFNDKRRGHKKGQSIRFILGHHARLQFGKPFYKIDSNGCWIWQAFKDRDGYGVKKEGGKTMRAHRYMYEQLKSKIPNGLHIDHLCRVRSCVNPDHLEVVTITENNRRSSLAKITRTELAGIRKLLKTDISQREIASRYSLSQSMISRIKLNKSWY